MFEKTATIYLSIESIEVEEDENQIEMVEDRTHFEYVVIRTGVFE